MLQRLLVEWPRGVQLGGLRLLLLRGQGGQRWESMWGAWCVRLLYRGLGRRRVAVCQLNRHFCSGPVTMETSHTRRQLPLPRLHINFNVAGSFCFGDADYARNVQADGSVGEWQQSLWVLTQVGQADKGCCTGGQPSLGIFSQLCAVPYCYVVPPCNAVSILVLR